MLSVKGIYQNGKIELEEPMNEKGPIQVIVTFLEPSKVEKGTLPLKDFSFKKSRKRLKKYKFSLSDAVIEDRNTER